MVAPLGWLKAFRDTDGRPIASRMREAGVDWAAARSGPAMFTGLGVVTGGLRHPGAGVSGVDLAAASSGAFMPVVARILPAGVFSPRDARAEPAECPRTRARLS